MVSGFEFRALKLRVNKTTKNSVYPCESAVNSGE
jgi:hypothetical protein